MLRRLINQARRTFLSTSQRKWICNVLFYFILCKFKLFYRTLRCCQLLLLPCSCYQHMCIPRVRRCISLFMWSEGRVSRVNMIHHVKYIYWYLFLKVCVFFRKKQFIPMEFEWQLNPAFIKKKKKFKLFPCKFNLDSTAQSIVSSIDIFISMIYSFEDFIVYYLIGAAITLLFCI